MGIIALDNNGGGKRVKWGVASCKPGLTFLNYKIKFIKLFQLNYLIILFWISCKPLCLLEAKRERERETGKIRISHEFQTGQN